MSWQYSTEILPALSGVVVALITAALSFINLTLSKEQKTSEFRQKWIDGLREDLSVFFASARAFARTVEEDRTGIEVFSSDKIAEFRHKAAETFYKIKLRLNHNETAHQHLMFLLEEINSKQNYFLANDDSPAQAVLSTIDKASEYSAFVLKSEWERVKAGELPFRLVRNWLAPLIVVASILFFLVVFFAKSKN